MAYLESDREPGSTEPEPARLSGKAQGRWLAVGLAVALLLAWEAGVRAGLVPALYFPAPSQIGWRAIDMLFSDELLANIGITLLRLSLAMLLGGIPGLIIGLLMGWSSRLRVVLDPFVAALHPIPKIAVLPLVMVIFGVGEASLVIVAALGAFFPMLINTMTGVWQIHPIHFDVARNYGANRLLTFQRVVWPGSLPLMFAGLRLALNATLLLTIAAEMFAPRIGLGAMIWMGWQTMLTENIYVSLLMITLLGILFSLLVDWMSRRWAPWEARHIA
jgi:ABC-type nitrate/sulfonate/bicarbonate transport system permease component